MDFTARSERNDQLSHVGEAGVGVLPLNVSFHPFGNVLSLGEGAAFHEVCH